IEKAIRLHNVFILPESLTERELLFCNILRDADKIDILKVNCDIPREEIYDKPAEEIALEEISEPVYEDVINCRNVDRKNVRTVVDSLVTQISFAYGLVYPESYRQTIKQGYLEKLLEFKSQNPKTAQQMEEIGRAVREYMDRASK
ncbi:MAG: metal-dependent phosphohydrolase, partial [Butyrivibrio sp.]|nr:metal-dependent phosphohydrolase [Butyrivibrio sp.]